MNLPTKERCEEVLRLPNHDVDHWTCPMCGDSGSRAHWVADHVLTHLRERRALKEPEPVRKIEVD